MIWALARPSDIDPFRSMSASGRRKYVCVELVSISNLKFSHLGQLEPRSNHRLSLLNPYLNEHDELGMRTMHAHVESKHVMKKNIIYFSSGVITTSNRQPTIPQYFHLLSKYLATTIILRSSKTSTLLSLAFLR